MTSWSITLPFNPMATPRPSFTVRNGGVITYYKTEYSAYLSAIQSYITSQGMYNTDFEKVVNSKYGVVANIIFYLGIPSSVKNVTKLTYTSKPDIDNLVKALLDGVFNSLKIKDSRVVGIKAVKLKTSSNPRTEVTLTGLNDLADEKTDKVTSKVSKVLTDTDSNPTWEAVFPFAPVSTPRPAITFTKVGTGSDGKPKYQKHTYNSTKYEKYLGSMKEYLQEHELDNDELQEVVNVEYGVIAKVNFFCKVPSNQKTLRKLLKTTAPDIDNLLKAVLDGIFNNLSADDSRVVGVQALKFNEIEEPRTEIRLTGLTRSPDGQ